MWIAVLFAGDFKNYDVLREPKPDNSLTGDQKRNTYAFLLRWRSKRKEVKSRPLPSKAHKSYVEGCFLIVIHVFAPKNVICIALLLTSEPRTCGN